MGSIAVLLRKLEKAIMVRTLLILFLIVAPLSAEESFIFESRERTRNDFLRTYPEKKELFERFELVLDTIAEAMGNREYCKMSSIVQEEIRLYDFNTDDTGELYLLVSLLKVDAMIDYYLLNYRRTGMNKNYLMLFLFGQVKAHDAVRDLDAWISFLSLSSILWNSHYANTFDMAKYGIFSVLALVLPGFFRYGLTGEEREEMILYYGVHEEGHPILYTVNRSLLYDYLVMNLFYMSDYKEDIRLYCSTEPSIREICVRAVNYSGGGIPIVDSSFYGVEVAVTFRKVKAFEFFERYYRNT
jgi:hypothetical protein